MKKQEIQIGMILLAAGASSRLGQPKQLLDISGKPLLQKMLDETININLSPKILVLGAETEKIRAAIIPGDYEMVYADKWIDGMAASLHSGIVELIRPGRKVDAVLIMLSDQPYVDADLLNKMLKAHREHDRGITACKYGDTIGVPAIFDNKYFPALLDMKGDHGAKQLITNHPGDVESIEFPMGATDIDTEEDYRQLLQQLKSKEGR